MCYVIQGMGARRQRQVGELEMLKCIFVLQKIADLLQMGIMGCRRSIGVSIGDRGRHVPSISVKGTTIQMSPTFGPK